VAYYTHRAQKKGKLLESREEGKSTSFFNIDKRSQKNIVDEGIE